MKLWVTLSTSFTRVKPFTQKSSKSCLEDRNLDFLNILNRIEHPRLRTLAALSSNMPVLSAFLSEAKRS